MTDSRLSIIRLRLLFNKIYFHIAEQIYNKDENSLFIVKLCPPEKYFVVLISVVMNETLFRKIFANVIKLR